VQIGKKQQNLTGRIKSAVLFPQIRRPISFFDTATNSLVTARTLPTPTNRRCSWTIRHRETHRAWYEGRKARYSASARAMKTLVVIGFTSRHTYSWLAYSLDHMCESPVSPSFCSRQPVTEEHHTLSNSGRLAHSHPQGGYLRRKISERNHGE